MGIKALDLACGIKRETEESMTAVAQCGTILFTSPEEVDIEADRLWNDPGILRDLIGDKLFWASNSMKTKEDKKLCKEICICLIQISHPAMQEAVQVFMTDHELFYREEE